MSAHVTDEQMAVWKRQIERGTAPASAVEDWCLALINTLADTRQMLNRVVVRSSIPCQPGAFTSDAMAYAQGHDSAMESIADDIREHLREQALIP